MGNRNHDTMPFVWYNSCGCDFYKYEIDIVESTVPYQIIQKVFNVLNNNFVTSLNNGSPKTICLIGEKICDVK